MDTIRGKCEIIEVLLSQIILLISNEIGENPYEDLEKAKKIASQKNISHLSSINKKLKNVTMLLYNRRLDNSDEIFKKLDEIYFLLNPKPS